ncbi:hypothetical protein K501DRAFT_335466 [Backusella circina FSU 941]|nr:hypothetical protein K501DRAFT_335466 [Backusella circina FSU 941]
MLRQLNNISRYTTSSLKYAASNTAALLTSSRDDPSVQPSQLTAYWINETQRGLDAFFNDQFELAQSIFLQHHQESPFHAVGYALMAYVEAMLGFESERIQIALDRIHSAEQLANKFIKKAKKKSWSKDELDIEFETLSFEEVPFKKGRTPEIQYELLATNCMLMASTIQFLRNSWLEYMKAAYKLRKAYKLYEHMFELLTGQRASDYASQLRQSRKMNLFEIQSHYPSSVQSLPVNSSKKKKKKKRASMYNPRKKSLDSVTIKPRPVSTIDVTLAADNLPSMDAVRTVENTIESGILFGLGLFSLIFSLLPPRVNKLLNTLGFHSSRPFALHLLQRSFNNQGLYSPLSALSLLAYYTNLSLFVHPKLLPDSLCLGNARMMLDQMKVAFPNGKMWKLLEGKLCKMEGKTRRGVEILRDARRNSARIVELKGKQYITKSKPVCELAQLQALAVYEMGWGQIFLGDYFQASETFFRLESMNNWSRAFYHYIATCCMFADEEYDKAAMEFMQIPGILRKKRQLGGKLLPNEIFAERKIKHWQDKAQQQRMQGNVLKQVVVVHPLWELIYLWNGFSQLSPTMLQHMKQTIETHLNETHNIGQDMPLLHLLLGVSVRELGDYDLADMYLQQSIKYDQPTQDNWVSSHTLYEMAALRCFQIAQADKPEKKKILLREAHEWINKSERHLAQVNNSDGVDQTGDSDWDSRLHVRCQLLLEKLDDFHNELKCL